MKERISVPSCLADRTPESGKCCSEHSLDANRQKSGMLAAEQMLSLVCQHSQADPSHLTHCSFLVVWQGEADRTGALEKKQMDPHMYESGWHY